MKYVNELIEFLSNFMHQPGLLPDQTVTHGYWWYW